MNPRGILSLLSLGLLSSTALAQDPSCRTDPVKLQLSHYEEAPSAPVTGGGGLVGALNRVTSEIENAGTGGQVGATYSVDLTAVVERQPDGASRVSLLMGEPGVDVDETLPQDSKTAAQRELKLLEAKLRRYTADVPDGAERLLQLNEILSHLKLFDQPTLQTIELCDPAGAGEAPVLQLVQDPESGEWVVEEVPPGTAPTGALVERLFSEYGAEILRVTGPDGQMRESVLWPDGTLTTLRDYAGEGSDLTTFSPDGQLDHIETLPDGGYSHRTALTDGTIVTEYRDADGKLVEKITQHPDGLVERQDASGGHQTTFADDETITVIETDRAGNTFAAVYDRDGNLIESDSDTINPKEPGRRYFEEQLGGTDWDDLPKSLKNRYADSERDAGRILEDRAREEVRAVIERRETLERQAEDAALNAETDLKLAAIAAEQEEADQKFAAAQARNERRNAIQASYEKADELQRQYDAAIARGDKLEAARIKNRQDDHHEASFDLLQPDAEEERQMEAQSEYRNKIVQEVRERAAALAEADLADDIALQDAKDATTKYTEYVSVGSEMQKETSKTTRMADRELAKARATQAEVERRLNDPTTSNAEREVLLEMRDLALVQEEGASRMLMDNAKITAAGYAIDAAMTATGGSLIVGAGKLAGRAVVRATGAVVGRELLETTAQAAATRLANTEIAKRLAKKGAKEILTERGVLELAGTGINRATSRAVAAVAGGEAGVAVRRALASDVGTPIAELGGRAARGLIGDTAVNAAKSVLTKAGKLAATDVTEIPGKLRRAVAGQADGGAGSAGLVNAVPPDGHGPRGDGPGSMEATVRDPGPAETKVSQPGPAEVTVREPGPASPAPARDPAQPRVEPSKPPSEMTPAERQVFNDENALRQARENLNNPQLDVDPGDDLLRSQSEPAFSRPTSAEELRDLHTPGRNLTPDEVLRKAEAYKDRELARKAYHESLSRRAAGEATDGDVLQAMNRYDSARNSIDDARAAARAEPPTGPGGAQRLPDQQAPVDRSAQTQPDFRAQDELDTVIDPGRPQAGGTDRLPGPATPQRGPGGAAPKAPGTPRTADYTPEEIANLHTTSRPLTPAELVRKGALYQQRENAALAYNKAISDGLPRAAIDARFRDYQRLQSAIGDGQKAASGAAETLRLPATDPLETARLPGPGQTPARVGPGGTQKLPDGSPIRVDRKAQTQPDFRAQDEMGTVVGAGGMRPAALASTASRGLSKLADDAAARRADWHSVPESIRGEIADDTQVALRKAAAAGDVDAQRVVSALDDGSLKIEFEPGLETPALSLESGRAIVNPMDGGRLRTGDEIAKALTPPPAAPARGQPPRLAELDAPDALQRAADPDALTALEREELGRLAKREAELKSKVKVDELTLDDLARWGDDAPLQADELTPDDLARMGDDPDIAEVELAAELQIIELERNAIMKRGADYRTNLALRERQVAAPDFAVAPGTKGASVPQPHTEFGENPLRHLVPGDKAYLADIMKGTGYVSGQDKVFTSTVNHHVQQMLDGRPFPRGEFDGPIKIRRLGRGDDPAQRLERAGEIIEDGHHRLIAAVIVQRLTGRRLLPNPANPLADSIIPHGQLEYVDEIGHAEVNWGSIGVELGDPNHPSLR